MRPRANPLRLARVLVTALAIAVLALFVVVKINTPEAVDAHIYWSARFPDLYRSASSMGDQDYHYSPAFAQALLPMTWLPFSVFQSVWIAAQVAVLTWMVGPIIAALLVLLPFTNALDELSLGNIHVLLAAAVVLSFRYPATWAFPLFTKVTPGIGVLWYGFRREWRRLWIAVGVTAALAAVSFALAPAQWAEWLGWLAASPPVPSTSDQLFAWAPLAVRLFVSVGLVGLAARTDEPWLMPVAVWLALPVIWYNSLIMLAAVLPLAVQRIRQRPGVLPVDL